MTLEERNKIISNDYANALLEHNRFDKPVQQFKDELLIKVNEKYGVYYFPNVEAKIPIVTEGGYALVPKLYGLMETTSLDAMGVSRVQNNPFLTLQGEGVLLGFVDTGIDYQDKAFLREDGTTRIVSIWDQSIANMEASEDTFFYGTEYTRDQINEALTSEDPYTVVPCKDENGHGTMLAGAAGGSIDTESDFQGVVPKAEFVIVKLKQAKQNLKDYFMIREGVDCYQEDDIMFGIQYLINVAEKQNRPITICIGLGTSQGAHDGSGILSAYIMYVGTRIGCSIQIAAGNEGNSKKHYYGETDAKGSDIVELNVGENERGFSMELWGYAPATYSIDILSPTGEYIPRIVARLGTNREIEFLYERTTVYVDYLVIEAQTGDPLVLIRFRNPAPGVWKLRIYGSGAPKIRFHIWLPISNFISEDTYFTNPNPDTTITGPGNTWIAVTVTAYDAARNTIYMNSSRGYTKSGNIKPNVAAPGVNVMVPVPGNKYRTASGTSIAAAFATGVAAMIMEWGIVKGNYNSISSIQMDRFLIRGVTQSSDINYPNNIWGYGAINIYNTFRSLSGSLEK
ncbi:MAG TPA: S8 family peptidase [Lachnospiraceae bacterium]|nr:S8 family peptidase [Lachnospiraceae bacterium]